MGIEGKDHAGQTERQPREHMQEVTLYLSAETRIQSVFLGC